MKYHEELTKEELERGIKGLEAVTESYKEMIKVMTEVSDVDQTLMYSYLCYVMDRSLRLIEAGSSVATAFDAYMDVGDAVFGEAVSFEVNSDESKAEEELKNGNPKIH